MTFGENESDTDSTDYTDNTDDSEQLSHKSKVTPYRVIYAQPPHLIRVIRAIRAIRVGFVLSRSREFADDAALGFFGIVAQ